LQHCRELAAQFNEEARAGPLGMARQYEQPGGWIKAEMAI
jgi:hypothetical protein